MRAKRKNISKALESIPVSNVPLQQLKPFCVVREPQHILVLPTANDDKGMRVLRRYRYKQNKEEESEANLNKYNSLEVPRRNLKRSSQHRLNQYVSIQNSPYKPFPQRKSVQRLHPDKGSTKRMIAVTLMNRQNKKNSISKKLNVKTKENSLDKDEVISIKQQGKQCIKSGHYSKALKLLESIDENNLNQTDIELLDLKGTCLMNLKRFQDALVKFSRILLLDKAYNKKVYISIALCQNQLNHAQRCLYYINQCIQLFPDFYQAFYFKGKLLFKQKMHDQAINVLLEASRLNPNKKEIKLLLAQCFEATGRMEQAIDFYSQYLTEINHKNVGQGIKYGCLLIECFKQSQAIPILEKCLNFLEQSSSSDYQRIKANYYLALAYFRMKKYDLCTMKGEEILNSSQSEYVPKAIRMLITCKILEHNYYESIYLLRRLDFIQSNCEELRIYVEFSEGVMLLMKKKISQGLQKLLKLQQMLERIKEDEFNGQVRKNYRLFIIYSYFIQGKYQLCLQAIQQQKAIGIDPYFNTSITYNEIICQAMLKYSRNQLQETSQELKKCISLFPDKAQTYLYLGLLHFQLYPLCASSEKEEECKTAIYENLSACIEKMGSANSNYAAHIYYFRALLYGWEAEWALAACDLDIAIQKSEDNFFNFYYLRAIVFANLQSYKQAISDVSIAISINEQAAIAYLLRAKCLQIDGNPSQAFADLQTFIALRPQDKQIHKFAGHLLFENGAFEDALQAYSQGQITEKDFEVYLTRSKTYFLLGHFDKSAEDLLEAAKMKGDKSELYFDYKVVSWLAMFFGQYVKQGSDCYSYDKQMLARSLQELKNIYKGSDSEYGKIFKLSEYLMLTGMCHFYLEDYQKAIDNLIEVIELKQLSMNSEEEGDFEEEEAEKLVFINQMYYNLSLCFCMLKDYPNAERYLKKCQIPTTSNHYPILAELLDQIKGKVAVDQAQSYADLFPLRNKLSRYLPNVKVPFLEKQSENLKFRDIKLCIPYPKVQPPEINPSFDRRLIDEVDLHQIERRAEAPWIFREKNSIKFTDRIDVYSRFEMQKSQVEQQKKHHIGVDFSDSSLSIGLNIKEKLKLDEKLQQKLNKLIKKQK